MVLLQPRHGLLNSHPRHYGHIFLFDEFPLFHWLGLPFIYASEMVPSRVPFVKLMVMMGKLAVSGGERLARLLGKLLPCALSACILGMWHL